MASGPGGLAERYRLDANPEWEALLRHFDLASGFSFAVLMVPDHYGAAICRQALANHLTGSGRVLTDLSPQTPEELRNIASALLPASNPRLASNLPEGVIWVEAAIDTARQDLPDWQQAFHDGAAQLNQFRNSLQQQLPSNLLFVVCPWVKAILREAAPDLWSVRSTVLEIVPQVMLPPAPPLETPVSRPEVWRPSGETLDPAVSLRAAEALRGLPGRELMRARLLQRAAGAHRDRFQLPEAIALLREVVELRAGFVSDDPADMPIIQRDLSISLNELGELLVIVGDLAAARSRFGESLAILERLARENPTSAEAQRDLSVSLNKLGEVLVAAGDLSGARERYGESLAIRERLARENPTSAVAQRDVSVSLNRLGDVLVAAGDLSGARERYGESLAIDEKLARENPTSAAAQRDVSVSLDRLGEVLVAAGELSGARERFGESLAIRERLARENPTSAEAQRDLIVSYWKLAEVSGEKVWWRRALAVAEELSRTGRLRPADAWMLERLRREAE